MPSLTTTSLSAATCLSLLGGTHFFYNGDLPAPALARVDELQSLVSGEKEASAAAAPVVPAGVNVEAAAEPVEPEVQIVKQATAAKQPEQESSTSSTPAAGSLGAIGGCIIAVEAAAAYWAVKRRGLRRRDASSTASSSQTTEAVDAPALQTGITVAKPVPPSQGDAGAASPRKILAACEDSFALLEETLSTKVEEQIKEIEAEAAADAVDAAPEVVCEEAAITTAPLETKPDAAEEAKPGQAKMADILAAASPFRNSGGTAHLLPVPDTPEGPEEEPQEAPAPAEAEAVVPMTASAADWLDQPRPQPPSPAAMDALCNIAKAATEKAKERARVEASDATLKVAAGLYAEASPAKKALQARTEKILEDAKLRSRSLQASPMKRSPSAKKSLVRTPAKEEVQEKLAEILQESKQRKEEYAGQLEAQGSSRPQRKKSATPAKTPAKEEIQEKVAQAMQEAAKRSSSKPAPDKAVKNLFGGSEEKTEEEIRQTVAAAIEEATGRKSKAKGKVAAPSPTKTPRSAAASPENVKAISEKALEAAKARRDAAESGPFKVSLTGFSKTPCSSPTKNEETKARMADALEAWGRSPPGLKR